MMAWLVWPSGFSAGLGTERLPVWFPVRAQGCGPGPQLGAGKRLPIDVSLAQ